MCTVSYVRVFACFQSISLIAGFYFFIISFFTTGTEEDQETEQVINNPDGLSGDI